MKNVPKRPIENKTDLNWFRPPVRKASAAARQVGFGPKKKSPTTQPRQQQHQQQNYQKQQQFKSHQNRRKKR